MNKLIFNKFVFPQEVELFDFISLWLYNNSKSYFRIKELKYIELSFKDFNIKYEKI
jgi:hypothetical protein